MNRLFIDYGSETAEPGSSAPSTMTTMKSWDWSSPIQPCSDSTLQISSQSKLEKLDSAYLSCRISTDGV